DTNFDVYIGTCDALVCYTSDDDSGVVACPGTGNSYLSTKTFEVAAGTTYYIKWDNKWTATGFDFVISEADPGPCTLAPLISEGVTTVASINEDNLPTSCSTATLAKWYRYIPSAAYHVTITSDLPQNLCKDTFFSVYTGSCLGTLTCITSDDNSGVLACNSGNTASNLSTKTFEVTPGTTYYIAWDNRWSASGFDFELIE